jgi:REP-associated tyrosine transposase
MARQLRIEYPGALYHVMSRGIERRELFRDDRDRERYLGILERSVERFGFRLYAYCLMGNHVHLALETGKVALSRVMKSVNTSYAGYFNVRHRRSGYLFQGRYKALLVDKDEYLLGLVRYIHMNPVKAAIVTRPGDYQWSSHRSYLSKAPKWLAVDDVLERFGSRRSVARTRFAEFFKETEERPYEAARRYVQTVVGEEGFARTILERAEPESLVIRKIEPANLVRWVAREEKVDEVELRGPGRRRDLARVRAICGFLAREVARLPLSRIARDIGRDTSTLWRDVEKLEGKMKTSPALRQEMQKRRARFVRWGNNT